MQMKKPNRLMARKRTVPCAKMTEISRCVAVWLWGSFVGALGSHWGRIGVALGWLWGRNRLPINTLWGGFDVALGGLRGLPPLFLLSALCFRSVAALSGFSRFEVQGSRFKVRCLP